MSTERLSRAFVAGRPAFVGYLMAGYPTREGCLEALEALTEVGVDLIELGVPYADPLADGPTIREAAEVARAAHEGGFGLAETIELAAEFIGAGYHQLRSGRRRWSAQVSHKIANCPVCLVSDS